jgi:hypothetical protein
VWVATRKSAEIKMLLNRLRLFAGIVFTLAFVRADAAAWPITTWGNNAFTYVADFNGDRIPDFASASGGTYYMKFSTGSGFNEVTWSGGATWGASGYSFAGDFNGDGLADIASANGGSVYVKLNTGSGFSQQTWSVANTWGTAAYTVAGDFNGDGRTDIASASGTNVYVKYSTGSGFTSQTRSVTNQWGAAGWTFSGDFNRDGYADIASASGGSIFMKLGGASGFTSVTWPVPNTWGQAGYSWAGDFNGDGYTDLASAYQSQIYLKLSNGSSAFSAGTWSVGNPTWLDISTGYRYFAGDFNSDGRADIAAPAGSSVWIAMNPAQQTPPQCQTIEVFHYSGFVSCSFDFSGGFNSFFVPDTTNPWVPGKYMTNFSGQLEWCRAISPVPYSHSVFVNVCP